jgi:hypothetical protein
MLPILPTILVGSISNCRSGTENVLNYNGSFKAEGSGMDFKVIITVASFDHKSNIFEQFDKIIFHPINIYTVPVFCKIVRFQVLTAASMMFSAFFWVVLPCKFIVEKHFTRQYNPEDSSEHSVRFIKIVSKTESNRTYLHSRHPSW